VKAVQAQIGQTPKEKQSGAKDTALAEICVVFTSGHGGQPRPSRLLFSRCFFHSRLFLSGAFFAAGFFSAAFFAAGFFCGFFRGWLFR
jgi:hypothetical protein